MAWWEYIPIVKTIGHIIEDPPGRKVSDYSGCQPSPEECDSIPAAAILKCTDCVKNKLAKYASDWTGSGIGSDFFEMAASAGAAGLGKALATSLGGTFLGLSATAWTGIGAVLAVDALVDAGVIISKLMDMWKAADAAMKQFCKCNAP